MPVEELKSKYGGKTKEAVNRAIRAECAGGDEAIDAMSLAKQICDRHGWADPDGTPSVHAVLYERLMWVVDAMEDDVRERWGLPEREDREDLRRSGSRRRGKGRS